MSQTQRTYRYHNLFRKKNKPALQARRRALWEKWVAAHGLAMDHPVIARAIGAYNVYPVHEDKDANEIVPLSNTGQPVVVGYTRVSSLEQVHGMSLQAQHEAIVAYHATHQELASMPLAGVLVDDGVSAWKIPLLSRKQGRRIITLPSGSVVLVTALDRAFRSLRDAIDTLEALALFGISLRVINLDVNFSSPIGKLVLSCLTVFAEWESTMRSERVRLALQEKLRRRIAANKDCDSGWIIDANDRLQPDPTWVDACNLFVELAEEGVGLAKMVGMLEIRYRTMRGETVPKYRTQWYWTFPKVIRLMRRFKPYYKIGAIPRELYNRFVRWKNR